METDISVSFGSGDGRRCGASVDGVRAERRRKISLKAKIRVAAAAVKAATDSLGKSNSESRNNMVDGAANRPG